MAEFRRYTLILMLTGCAWTCSLPSASWVCECLHLMSTLHVVCKSMQVSSGWTGLVGTRRVRVCTSSQKSTVPMLTVIVPSMRRRSGHHLVIPTQGVSVGFIVSKYLSWKFGLSCKLLSLEIDSLWYLLGQALNILSWHYAYESIRLTSWNGSFNLLSAQSAFVHARKCCCL